MSSPVESHERPWWRSRGWLWLVAAGALWRLLLVVHLALVDPLLHYLISDASYYHDQALVLARGEAFRPGLPHWLPPLYPWALSLLYRVTDGALAATLALQALVGLGVHLAVARLAARVTDERTGLVAGWLWLLYGPVIFFETRLLGINAALPLCLLALHAGLSADARARDGERAVAAGAMAGLAAGLAALARPNLLLSLPGAGLALVWVRRRAGASVLVPTCLAAALGLAAGVAPGLVSNLQRSELPVLVSANGGINLWFGNNAEAHGTFHAPGPEWGSIRDQREVSLGIASEAEGRELDDVEGSAWWSRRARAWAFEHPLDALRLVGLKLADSASNFEFGIQYVYADVRSRAPLLWLSPIPFGLLLALAALGLGRVRQAPVLLGWVAAGVVASLLYFTYSRFRLPWLPALLPFSAAGLLALVDAARGARRPRPALLLVSLALLAQSFVPFEGEYPRLLVENGRDDAKLAWYQLGLRSREAGDLRAAEREFARALSMDPGLGVALYELSSLDLASGDPERAARALERMEAFQTDADARRRSGTRATNDVDILLAAALYERSLTDPRAFTRARALVQGVLERDPEHEGAKLLADRIR